MTDPSLRILRAARHHIWNGNERLIMSYGPQPATICGAIGMAEDQIIVGMSNPKPVLDAGFLLRRRVETDLGKPNVRQYLLRNWNTLPEDLKRALRVYGKPTPQGPYDLNNQGVQAYRLAWLVRLIKEYEGTKQQDT